MLTETTRYGVAMAEEVGALSGLQVLHRIIAGDLPAPPIARTLNFWLSEVSEGRAVFEGDPGEDLLNPLGAVHGGWLLTLIDSAAGCAAQTTLPAGVGYTTIETKANFSRPIKPDSGRVRAEGLVVAAGRRIISTEVRVTDKRGRLLGHRTSTLMVLRPERA